MDILKCAEDAGFEVARGEILFEDFLITGDLHAFARLVLEEAALACERKGFIEPVTDHEYDYNELCDKFAAAVRALKP